MDDTRTNIEHAMYCIATSFKDVALGFFWFAFGFLVVQLARFVSAVNGASVVTL